MKELLFRQRLQSRMHRNSSYPQNRLLNSPSFSKCTRGIFVCPSSSLRNTNSILDTDRIVKKMIDFDARFSVPILICVPIFLLIWAKMEQRYHNTKRVQYLQSTYLVAVAGMISSSLFLGNGWLKTSFALQAMWRFAGICSLWVWQDLRDPFSFGKGWLHICCGRWRAFTAFYGTASILLRVFAFVSSSIFCYWGRKSLVRNLGCIELAFLSLSLWAGYFFTAFLPYRILHSSYQTTERRIQQLALDLADLDEDMDFKDRIAMEEKTTYEPTFHTTNDSNTVSITQFMKVANLTVVPKNKIHGEDLTQTMMAFWYHIENNSYFRENYFQRINKANDGKVSQEEMEISRAMDRISMAGYGRLWRSENEPDANWSLVGIESAINTCPNTPPDSREAPRISFEVDDPYQLDLFSQSQLLKQESINKERAKQGKVPWTLQHMFETRMEFLNEKYMSHTKEVNDFDLQVELAHKKIDLLEKKLNEQKYNYILFRLS